VGLAFVAYVRAVAEATRVTIHSLGRDPRSAMLSNDAAALGLTAVESIEVADIVFFDGELSADQRAALETVLVDPLLQRAEWDAPTQGIETAILPGVTDSAAGAAMLAAATVGVHVRGAASGKHFAVTGTLDEATQHMLARRLLANEVIEHWAPAPITPAFLDVGATAVDTVSTVVIRGLDADALHRLNRERGLALDAPELRVIVDHFAGIGRDPTDVELEMLAQTWSEHCAHKTFRALITTDTGVTVAPLLNQLRDATDAIAAPFLRSAFVGNAGIVSFSPGTTLAVKAETHNHPSAIEPFGGANTGVGGVIRDVMGAAHHPIAVTDILCFGPADWPSANLPDGVLHPRLVAAGVIAGVADYGNKIGLPTVAGAVLYDPGYVANPLVYCGCIGVADEVAELPGPQPGDLVVVIGGRTGRDGLRGATFSSATMDATTGDVAGASVQIGDPIMEKLVIDALADLHGLYTSITDCGAGGLSSAIGEMAEGVGADVDVALAPLKYPGLAPWEIWLSEAQERMVLSVPPAGFDDVAARCLHHGVQATSLGTFTGTGVLRVRSGTTLVAELDTVFLHDGRPQRSMQAVLPAPDRQHPVVPECPDPAATLLQLLAHPNIASKETVIRRFDHEIGGGTVVRPLVGTRGCGPADGVVLARPADTHGVAIGIGVNPWYGLLDPERMALAVVDEAIRNVVAVGADPDRVALLDNFSWGDPRRPTTLGELVAAVRGCCDASVAHDAPFVSGKDSLNNEYLGADGLRHSVPPTLVITAVAHVPDANRVVTPDLKRADDLLVLVGRTLVEFGGSHFRMVDTSRADATGDVVPAPDAGAPARYRHLHRAMQSGRIRACPDLSEGGLAVTLAEMAIAGELGVLVDLTGIPADPVSALFAESTGRFVCEVAAEDVGWLALELGEDVTVVGRVTIEQALGLPRQGHPLLHHHIALSDLTTAFTGTRARTR
jgi:phosphoribosylformylglycinamidine synthase II